MKTKLMLIGLMMCVGAAPLWAAPSVEVGEKLVDQHVDLDAEGPDGWVALAVQEPNALSPTGWDWAGPADLISPAWPAMYKTADDSSIAFIDYEVDVLAGTDPTLRTTTNTNTAGTYWFWKEGVDTVEHKEHEAGGDKRFALRSSGDARQKIFYNFLVQPIEVGVQHNVTVWFYSRGHGTNNVVLYGFYVDDVLVYNYVPRSSNYFQATLKIVPDSLDDVVVSVAFEPHSSQGDNADRGGVIAAALSRSYEAEVITQPVSQTVAIGSDVTLSITAGNAETYQWFKDGKALNGANAATLTITDVQVADEGFYFCQVNNDIGTPDDSDTARLLTKRLVGWWKLDNDPNDSVQDRYSAAPRFGGQTSGDPNYLDGIDGKAIQFTAKAGEIVNMPGSSAFYNFYQQGYTVSAWVKASAPAAWGAFVSKMYAWEMGAAANHYGYALMHDNSGNAVFVQRRNMGNLGSGVQICDDTWHLVTGTWDPSDMIARVYVDGLLENESGVQTQLPVLPPSASDPERSNVRIGADGDVQEGVLNSPYIGLVDDVRIYSYPLSPSQVYYLYSDLVPGAPTECLEYHPFDITGPDGVPDCIVNLYDFAAFAEVWLECFVVPDCL